MRKFIFLCFVFGIALQVCWGQEEMSPAEKKQKTLVTEPLTLYKGFFRAQVSTYYALIYKVFVDEKKQSLDGNGWGDNFSLSADLQYGVSDRFMVEVAVPYVRDRIFQSFRYEVPVDPTNELALPTSWETKGAGIGDMEVALSYQVITETPSRPAVGAVLRVTLPTGEKDVTDDHDDNPNSFNRATGQGEVAINTTVRLRKVNYPFAYGGSVGYVIKNEVSKVVQVDAPPVSYKNGNFLNLSAFMNVSLNDWVAMRNFLEYYHVSKDQINGSDTGDERWLFEFDPGFSFQLKRFRFDQYVVIPLKANIGAADPAYILLFQYTF
jgi:hypothetical protein